LKIAFYWKMCPPSLYPTNKIGVDLLSAPYRGLSWCEIPCNAWPSQLLLIWTFCQVLEVGNNAAIESISLHSIEFIEQMSKFLTD
jgi:hypothetical protein